MSARTARAAPAAPSARPASTVVKLGGSLLEDGVLRAAVLDAIAARRRDGERLVVVHGGGRRVDAWLARVGLPRRVHEGLRVTDAATLEVVIAVLAGLIGQSLVAELAARGIAAAGLSGSDGATLRAEPLPPAGEVEYGYVGRIVATDPRLVHGVLDAGLLPLVAPLAAGAGATLLNLNADAAAAALAGALGARRLVFLTDVEGVLDAEGRLLERIDPAGAAALLASDAVDGGMRPKLAACLEALAAGVAEVIIAGPSRHGAVLRDGRGGTRLVAA